jgi:hypothetical protein
MKPDLVDMVMIAERVQVERAAITMWRKRYSDFPPPYLTLRIGEIWRWSDVYRWLVKTGRDHYVRSEYR